MSDAPSQPAPTPAAERSEAPGPPEDAVLWRTLQSAAARDDVDRALRDLYARLDAAVAARGPTCWQSGKCCKFDSYGHRLYVTALEIAWFLREVSSSEDRVAEPAGATRLPILNSKSETRNSELDGCAYQVDGLCTAHTVRPLGCRVFFCEQGTEAWQQELYERFLAELRGLHERFGLPYRYLEWRAGLDEALASVEGVEE